MSAFYTTVARFYDAETADRVDDLALYSRLADEVGAPIFDVGCGTGRVLLHLAQEGHRAHGVDNDAAMLARLETKLNALPHLREFVTYEQADILTYRTTQRCPLVLLTYNALMHFHAQEAQIALLKRLRALIAEGGRLVIDLPNAGETFATQDSDALLLDRTFIDPDSGHLIMLQSHSVLDRTTQLLHVKWIYDEIDADGVVHRLIAPHVLRYFFYPEMTLLLKLCGFRVEAVYGGCDEEPFEDGCERMVIYARPE
ncbi:MAG: class I SAM-dependent methyltransferase [Anaerolineae bacterium]